MLAQNPLDRLKFDAILQNLQNLQENPSFILDIIDDNYIDLIDQYSSSFGKIKAPFSIEQYIKPDTPTFTQVSIKIDRN